VPESQKYDKFWYRKNLGTGMTCPGKRTENIENNKIQLSHFGGMYGV
jgi:hypothetical protein